MSLVLYLGPRFYFMLCGKKKVENIQKNILTMLDLNQHFHTHFPVEET